MKHRLFAVLCALCLILLASALSSCGGEEDETSAVTTAPVMTEAETAVRTTAETATDIVLPFVSFD